MKSVIAVFIFTLILPAIVSAADITIKWDFQSDADGYRVRHSIDNGLTWEGDTDVGNVDNALCVVPDSVLVLIQVGAYNTQGTTWRTDAGVFYNSEWSRPKQPTGTGVQ